MRSDKRTVAVFHPRLGFGGSEAVAMWTLEALKREYRIALIAGGRIDLPKLNAFYGTSVSPEECEVVELKLPWPLSSVDWGAALRGVVVDRLMRRHFDRFDVLVNSYNIGDFGRPGIHFLADFSWDEALRYKLDPSPPGLRGLFHTSRPLRGCYLRLTKAIAATPRSGLRNAGMILANSNWSMELLRRQHGLEAQLLYPPVAMRAARVPPERKLRRFVSVGRISREKRIEQVVAILKAVRSRGHDVALHIIGDAVDTAYGRQIEQQFRAEGDWIVLEGRLFGEPKARILAESAYGIHARSSEAFGIAVAEMVKAGCITFAPAEGGPAEILSHEALLFCDDDDAVEKICAVLSRPALQATLFEHLERQAEKFSAENFMRDLRAAVEKFLAKSSLSAGAPTAACGPARSLLAPL